VRRGIFKAKLEPRHVKMREANGASLHYVEGWHVIAEANRSARPFRSGIIPNELAQLGD